MLRCRSRFLEVALIPFLALAVSGFAGTQAHDPLFQKMAGHWLVSGTRYYVNSNRIAELTGTTDAEIRQTAGTEYLVSKNQVTEDGRSYSRVYWIKAEETQPGLYELGSGEDPSGPVGAKGALSADGTVFQVTQSMGGEDGFVIDSLTSFESTRTVYTDQSRLQGKVQAETHLEYLRR